MHATLPLLAQTDFPPLRRRRLDTLQVNLGYRCNQSCVHCHVNAGPNRTEMMDGDTVDLVLEVLRAAPASPTLDLTGGAPELNPHFRRLAQRGARAGRAGDRPLQPDDPVRAGAGRPGRVPRRRARRGRRVAAVLFARATSTASAAPACSTRASRRCSSSTRWATASPTGPGAQPGLQPAGAGAAARAARAARPTTSASCGAHFGIRFNHLFALANMPIQRFGSTLVSKGKFHALHAAAEAMRTAPRTSTP